MSRSLAILPVRLVVFSLLAAWATWPLLTTAAEMNVFRDAQVLLPYERNAAGSVLRYLQAPLWDPNYCGGLYALANPQSRFVSPTFLLTLIFGAMRAESITAFLMTVLGMEGLYRYARSYGAGGLGAVLAAPVFAASGNFATAPFFGWTHFFGFELLPWAALGVRKAVRGDQAGIVICAVALGWTVGFGGTYAAPMAALLCLWEVFESLINNVRAPRRMARVIGFAALCATLAIGIAAVRLWPLSETLVMAPRIIGGLPGHKLAMLWDAMTGQVSSAGAEWKTIEGMFLIGWLVVPALVFGLTRRRSVPVAIVAALSLWAATGHAMGWSPFVGLKHLPIYGSLRYPERYLILFALAVAVIASTGVRTLEARSRRRPWWSLGLAILVVALAGNSVFLVRNFHEAAAHRRRAAPAPELRRDFHQARGTRWANLYYAPMSRGCLSCWEAYPVPQSPLLRGDLQQEEYLQDSSSGEATRKYWSHNRLDVEVDLKRSARLLINQNHHSGWHSSVGQVVSEQGLLAVELPAGRHTVVLRFLPRSAIGGAVATILGLIAAGWFARRALRRQRLEGARAWTHSLLWVGAPLLSVPVCWFIIREPALQIPPPRAPTGEVITVASLPEGTPRFDVAFEVPVVLEGGKIDPTVQPGRLIFVEIDWRTSKGVPQNTSVFVHAEGPGDHARSDHRLLSKWIDLHHAPRDQILRDIVPIVLPEKAQSGEWTVWVGLWNEAPPYNRYHVVDRGQAPNVFDNRIQIGTIFVQ